jgi:hypothetical protein
MVAVVIKMRSGVARVVPLLCFWFEYLTVRSHTCRSELCCLLPQTFLLCCLGKVNFVISDWIPRLASTGHNLLMAFGFTYGQSVFLLMGSPVVVGEPSLPANFRPKVLTKWGESPVKQ